MNDPIVWSCLALAGLLVLVATFWVTRPSYFPAEAYEVPRPRLVRSGRLPNGIPYTNLAPSHFGGDGASLPSFFQHRIPGLDAIEPIPLVDPDAPCPRCRRPGCLCTHTWGSACLCGAAVSGPTWRVVRRNDRDRSIRLSCGHRFQYGISQALPVLYSAADCPECARRAAPVR